MLRDDGVLVYEENLWGRIRLLWDVYKMGRYAKAHNHAWRLSWRKFIPTIFRILVFKKIQAIPKEDMENLKGVLPTENTR